MMLRESESRVKFFKIGAGHLSNMRENELIDNKMNITIQNRLMNYVKNDIKNIIKGILIRYDNYIYYRQYKRFFKDNRTVLEKLKDKVNLAIACFNKNISKYNVSGSLDGHPHSIWIDSLGKGSLRRTKRNRVK
jgi:hypothetical protein